MKTIYIVEYEVKDIFYGKEIPRFRAIGFLSEKNANDFKNHVSSNQEPQIYIINVYEETDTQPIDYLLPNAYELIKSKPRFLR